MACFSWITCWNVPDSTGTSDTDDNSYQVNSDYCMDSVNNHVGRHWRGIQSNYYCTGGILPDSGKYGKWCREGVSAVVTAVASPT